MALGILVADQALKAWILYGLDLPRLGQVEVLPFFNLTMVWNRGVTFGLLGDALPQWLFALLALGIGALLVGWMARSAVGPVALALGAVLGGAIGNAIDRLRFGAVVDFLHLHAWGWHWYVFNLADAAIVCGVAVLAWDSFRSPKAEAVGSGQG